MKTIAIPTFGCRVSPRLDCAESLLIFTTQNEKIEKREEIRLIKNSPLVSVAMLKELQVDVLICGGVTKSMANKLESDELEVISWVSGDAEDVLGRYLSGEKFES